MIRTSFLAAAFLAAAIGTSFAAQPVKGAVQGTKEVGTGVVQGAGQVGKGVVQGTGTVVRKTGKGLKCVFTLGTRC
jgi:hypothetical protein